MEAFIKRCEALAYITDLSISFQMFLPGQWGAAFEDWNENLQKVERFAVGEGKTPEEALEAAYEDYNEFFGGEGS